MFARAELRKQIIEDFLVARHIRNLDTEKGRAVPINVEQGLTRGGLESNEIPEGNKNNPFVRSADHIPLSFLTVRKGEIHINMLPEV